jgi:proline iminopeptidase
VLAGHEPEVGHELARTVEAAHVAEFAGEDHGGLSLEAAEAADTIDEWLVSRRESEGLDPLIELVSALQLVLEQREVLGEHDGVFLGQSARLEHLSDPVQVALGPVGAVAIDEAAPAHELQDVVTRLDDLALEGLAAAHEIPDPLVGLGRDVDEDEPVVGIATVGLTVLTRSTRDERWGSEFAVDTPLGERALQHVACARSLVANLYDQRGTGQSSLVSDSAQLAAFWFAEDLEAVRSHFELERLNILGHSWGAGVAALYAMRYPARVGRLVIVGGVPLQEELLTAAFDQMQAARDSSELREMEALFAQRVANPEDAEACRAYYVLWFRPFFGDSSAADRSRGDFCSGSGEALRNKMASVDRFTMASLGSWDWREPLRDLDAPTLVIHGTSDPLLMEGARNWARTLPDARLLTLPDIGHFPYLESPDQFFSAVRRFVRGGWPAEAERVDSR